MIVGLDSRHSLIRFHYGEISACNVMLLEG